VSELVQRDRPATFVARLRINRPDVRNAMNRAVLQTFHDHLDALAEDDVRALIITGIDGAFSAGADLREVRTFTSAEGQAFSRTGHALFERIEQLPYPVIAAISGHALGGGCELACACDVRYAVASARLGQPESTVGMIPGWGGTFRLPRIIGLAAAKELIFTGALIDAHEAHELGLVNRVYEEDAFEEKVLEQAKTIASNAPIANREAKRLLDRYAVDRQTMINEESLSLAYCISTEDQSEAIDAFLEKRTPSFNNR
jgi:enoyl-CoA hydratase